MQRPVDDFRARGDEENESPNGPTQGVAQWRAAASFKFFSCKAIESRDGKTEGRHTQKALRTGTRLDECVSSGACQLHSLGVTLMLLCRHLTRRLAFGLPTSAASFSRKPVRRPLKMASTELAAKVLHADLALTSAQAPILLQQDV